MVVVGDLCLADTLFNGNPRGLKSSQRQIHLVKIKNCEDTRPRKQLEASTQQHSELCGHPQPEGATVTLHTILLGVGVVIYALLSIKPVE